jgi:hypothetical protein
MLLLNAIYSYFESKWLALSATATSTLILTDAWFDVMTSHAGKELNESVVEAIFVEIPLALITFLIALRIINEKTRN